MSWGSWIFGFVVGIVILPIIALVYIELGMAPVATSAGTLPFERFVTATALHAKIDREAPKTSPIQPSEANLMEGAHIYRENCTISHALPGQDQSAIAKGEFLKPPGLFRGKGVTDDPVGEIFWQVKDGIRLTGCDRLVVR